MATKMYKRYSTFEEIDNSFLKSYNRVVTAINITESHGEEESKAYLGQLTKHDQKLVYVCANFIKKYGIEEVKRQAQAVAGVEENA